MRRSSERWLLAAVVGAFGLVVVLAAVLAWQVVDRRSRAASAVQHVIDEPAEPEAVDPYAGRAEDAIARVQGVTVAAGQSIGERIRAGELERRVELFARAGVEREGWTARRTPVPTIYAVEFAYRFHSVVFGPQWYVQLDAEGMQPERSGGVVPANALAAQLHRVDMDEQIRALNRSDEVLEALTQHQFEGGSRLGSALLVYFRGGEDVLGVDETIGWLVVPESADDDGALSYRAYFQWLEEGEAKDAWWEVNLTSREFQPRDIQANRIMERGAEVDVDDMIEILPRSIELETPPEDEPDARRRALRYVLADARRVEAVRALMTYRGRSRPVEYDGWQLTVTDERHVYDVVCRFKEDAVEQRVEWRVRANDGTVTPAGDIARLAERVLTMADRPAESP